MRFGTWNVKSLCRVGAIKSVVGELEKYKLDFTTVSRTALGPTQPPIQWVRGGLSLEAKRPGDFNAKVPVISNEV
jgi:hypothetical protein